MSVLFLFVVFLTLNSVIDLKEKFVTVFSWNVVTRKSKVKTNVRGKNSNFVLFCFNFSFRFKIFDPL